MHPINVPALILTFLCIVVAALHESDVGIVDWHQPLVGLPLTSSPSTALSFQIKTGQSPTEALLLTATDSNVLAALHASNGSLAWRFIYQPTDRIVHYRRHKETVVALSGPGGIMIRRFDYATGQLVLEKRLHAPHEGHRPDRGDFGTSTALAFMEKSQDLIALTCGRTVQRVGESGKILWVWEAPINTVSVNYAKLVTTPSAVYVIGLEKSFSSYTLRVTSLSSSTGEVLSSVNIPSSIVNGSSTMFTLSSDTSTVDPRVVWLEAGAIHSVSLVPSLTDRPTAIQGSGYKKMIDIGLENKGIFIALKADDTGRVFRLSTDKGILEVIWEFADSAKSDRYAESLYVGGLDGAGFPYIGRIVWSFVLSKATAHVYAPHMAARKGLLSGFTFDFDTSTHGIISHVALHTAYVKELDLLPYLALTTTTGAIQLWRGDIVQWTREEGLSRLQVAEMVELPERKIIAAHIVDQDETMSDRIRRQLADVKGLPRYILHFIRRFATNSYASTHQRTVPASMTTSAFGPLARDAFGFRQVIVAANDLGKVYGLDSSSGAVLWSRILSFGSAVHVGAQITPVKIFVLRTVAHSGVPEVVLVTQRHAANGRVDTVIFHVNAFTGDDLSERSSTNTVLQGVDIISGPLSGAFPLPGINKAVMLLDESLNVYFYPETFTTDEREFAKIVSKLNVALPTSRAGQPQLTGHHFSTTERGRATAFATWASSFPLEERIFSIISRPSGPIASLGNVLGNRTTLYKYLNAHLVAVTTVSPTTCGVYVLDAAKGNILYHASIGSGEGERRCDLHATFVENWLVYVYWDAQYQGVETTKGHRLVTVELYEGALPDDKTRSLELSSYSNRSLAITTIEQSYIFPHAITSITTTSTKHGVSTKDIIVANENGQIQSFPRLLLNPRRTKDKPTAEDQEEWLVQYDPVLPDDTRRVLSHNYYVAKVRRILTAPTLLESTSIIFAYGLDLFCTRMAPSGTFDVLNETFNKAQLVFTICGLAIAIVATRPMMRRKRIREKWYQ
ncbi:DUF1620-domain-containing protein [Russula earlei]|uniref:DUF1620-domain-containing protein n=1 Tax=Russula earlei TaxID=71964 RepID=A0ACC0UGF8_9AGAM|nr:DUF1620-domain-containing protein [Russula earlei]